MERKPLIKNPWLRVVLFIVSLLGVYMLLAFAAGHLFEILTRGKKGAGGARTGGFSLNDTSHLVPLLSTIGASLFTVYVFRKKVDRQSVYSLGLALGQHRSSAAAGLFLGLVLLGLGTLALALNRNLQWEDVTVNPEQLALGCIQMLLIAFTEELVFRGYILNNLLPVTNKWTALLASAVIFTLFHIGNPGISTVAAINIFLAGLMLGINYIYTKNLWFGILLHFTWNFYMGCILGYKVSGLQFQSLLQQELSGSTLFTGGNFGFEGSVVASVLFVLAAGALALIYEKKSTPLQPPGITETPAA